MRLDRSFFEILIWTTIWFVLSFTYGALFGDHVWMLVPIMGTAYGFLAGIIYSIMSFVYRWRRECIGGFIAMIIGLMASVLTVPILIAMGVRLEAAIIFTVISGSTTGLVVNLLTQRKQDYGPTS